MMLDYMTIIGRAAWVRSQAGLVGAPPPYSSRDILDKVFPNIAVSGTKLPKRVTEMAVADGNKRALFYNRDVSHPHQRVGLMHGLYHHLSDIKGETGLRECNLLLREMSTRSTKMKDPVELACDLFAAEMLIPLDVLDQYTPLDPFPKNLHDKAAADDEIDHLSSRFNVPRGFMRWRLFDLLLLRRSHYNL